MRKYYCKNKSTGSALALLIMLTAFSFKAAAVDEPQSVTKKGTELLTWSPTIPITNSDHVFGTGGWSSQLASGVQNIVLFEIDFNNSANTFFQNLTFTATCRVDIKCYGNPASPGTITQSYDNIDLVVNFNPAAGATYKGIADYKFNGAYRVDVFVKSITATGLSPLSNFPVFSLTNKMIVNRQYNFDDNSTNTIDYTTDGKKLNVSWIPTQYPGAESFDLEWTYLDETSTYGALIKIYKDFFHVHTIPVSILEAALRNNSSRVNIPPSTTNNSYEFNLNYNKGFVIFRIRGVQFRNSDGLRLEGNWNYNAHALTGSGYDWFNQGIIGVEWHEPNLNWQYNSVYAEDGKKKEVISYFDGALRSRQTVTLNNEDNVSVVAEPVYDALGRPSMSILPAPVYNENTLKYYRSFNVNNSLRPVSYKDIPSANCGIIASPLSSTSGVEQYYSANNPFMADATKPWNKAIPKSEGFPFAVTQYTPDNTGRIRAQGGVGKDFQLNTGTGISHETKYYYGKPSQYELDRIFGAEAGEHTHYLKNMVQDANGQVSVSYQNSDGKTVATSLAGIPPTNLEALGTAGEPTATVKDIMITPSSFQINNARSSLEATNTFLVASTGNYLFTYRFVPEQYRENFSGGTLCYTCTYDLLITLKDECGNVLQTINTKNVRPFNTTCDNPAEYSGNFSVPINKIGEYTAYFELVVSKETLDAYTEHYLQNNTDIKKLNYFLLEQLIEENLAECYDDCESCKTLPATEAEFIAQIQAYYTKEGLPFGSPETAYATQLYNTIRTNCAEISTHCLQSPCDEILDVIKADVTPGGQYAEFDNEYHLIDPEINVLAHYQTPPQAYIPASIEDDNGNLVPVTSLTLKEFILKFQDSWAASLAPLHPEYCYYTWCTMNSASQTYNQTLENLNDPVEAIARGYFDRNNIFTLLQNDPFFNLGGYGAAYYGNMAADLDKYSYLVLNITNQNSKDILKTIDYLLYCGNQDPAIGWDDCNKEITDPCRSDYKEWLLFRDWYLDRKLKYYTMAMKLALPGCTNCYIPSSGGVDPGGWTNCIAPPASDFSVSVVPNSSADGIKRIVIKYRDGNEIVNWPISVTIQMSGGGIALTQDVIFTPGFGSQEMLVQDELTTFNITATSCAKLTEKMASGRKIAGKNYPSLELNEKKNILKTIQNLQKENKAVPAPVHNAEGSWKCPIDANFDVSFIPQNAGRKLQVCYNGPPIPDGIKVTVSGTLVIVGQYQQIIVLEFCSNSPLCQIVSPYIIDEVQADFYINSIACDSKTGCSQVVSCLPESQYTIDYTTGVVCSFTNSTFNISIDAITAGCGTVTYSMGTGGYGNCQIFPGWNAQCPILAVTNLSITNCSDSWECPTSPNNYTATTTFNNTTQQWDIKICYTGPPIPAGKTVSVPVTAINYGCKVTVEFTAKFCQSQNCFTYSVPASNTCDDVWRITYGKITCQDENCPGSCPLQSEFTAAVNSAASCSTPIRGYTSENIRVTHTSGPVTITAPVQRVKVKVKIITKNITTNKTFVHYRFVWFINGDSFKNFCFTHHTAVRIESVAVVSTECSGACPASDCCNDPRYSLYEGKVRRFQDYIEPDFDAIQHNYYGDPANTNAYPVASCKNECEAMADGWIQDLKNCTNDLVKLERVRRRLIDVCKQSCKAQQGNPIIHPFSDLNPDPSFEKIIIEEFGSLTPDCAYDLISDPYPWGKTPVTEKTFAIDASSSICDRLNLLIHEAAGNGYSTDVNGVHKYLRDYYSPYYDLELDDLQQLFTACQECNYIMKLPVELPPFMNGDYKECLDCELYETKKAEFESKYPGITPAHPKYEMLFRNFMNHQTGFSHAYANYYDFELKCQANEHDFRRFGHICETPLQLEMDINPVSQCMDEKFYNALSNATVIYERYIEEVKRIFRNNYTAKCLTVKPRLESEAKLYEYHYTLYYYDQSDNLVKTVPPKGVAYLTDAQINTLWTDRTQFIVPSHTLATTYQYNSFNQVVKQFSPDGGTSQFWYDRLGRLTVSQNEEQKTPSNGGAANRYSYTKYEPLLGRINEVGEKSGAADISTVNTRDDNALNAWLASGTDAQITSTIYDKVDLTQVTNTSITNEQPFYTSRKRVVATIFRKTRNANPAIYDAATHYSYDISGNAKIVWQENTRLKEADATTQGLKRMDYEFDLVSGKVNKVWYQKNKGDQFIYLYKYDAENRVTGAQSSRDGLIWQNDASYKYYLHGPLARTELGNLKVQGMDYAYTLQGWMKFINAPALNEKADIGRDGDPTLAGNVFANVARDAMSYGISYFNGEYKPIAPNSPLSFTENVPASAGTGKDLFNGNIRATTLQIAQLGTGKTYSYSYDQLNRIVKMRKHETTYTLAGNPAVATLNINPSTSEYQEDVTYDPNGNIMSYLRNGTAAQPAMDNLTYHYIASKNQLEYVQDGVLATNYTEDIDDQNPGNYTYDKIGNLTRDNGEKIGSIEWTVYGKISKITKTDVSSTTIEYEYDATGNRIYKKVSTSGSAGTVKYTWYVRDASGNTMAIYTRTGTATVQWSEQHLYGSSRLGMTNLNIDVPAAPPVPAPGAAMADGFDYGKIVYELSNHLGNVLATISDKKTQVQNGTTGTVLYYMAEVVTATDYYPFGMQMPGRKYEPVSGYRYGFNGQEKDYEVNESITTALFWEYDSRVAFRWNIDPKSNTSESPYLVFGGDPILYNDPLGDTPPGTGEPPGNSFIFGVKLAVSFRSHKLIFEDAFIKSRIGMGKNNWSLDAGLTLNKGGYLGASYAGKIDFTTTVLGSTLSGSLENPFFGFGFKRTEVKKGFSRAIEVNLIAEKRAGMNLFNLKDPTKPMSFTNSGTAVFASDAPSGSLKVSYLGFKIPAPTIKLFELPISIHLNQDKELPVTMPNKLHDITVIKQGISTLKTVVTHLNLPSTIKLRGFGLIVEAKVDPTKIVKEKIDDFGNKDYQKELKAIFDKIMKFGLKYNKK